MQRMPMRQPTTRQLNNKTTKQQVLSGRQYRASARFFTLHFSLKRTPKKAKNSKIEHQLIVRSMKQGFGDILHAQLGEDTSLASLDGIHRLAHSVGNVIHRIALGRQSQNISLCLAQGYAFFLFPLVAQCG